MAGRTGEGEHEGFWHGAHRLFWALIPAALLAVWAAVSADGAPPAAALGSDVLWRLEVAGAALLAAYIPLMTLWFAYEGKWLKVPVPTGGSLEPGEDVDDADGIDIAADEFETFMEKTNRRLALQEEMVEALNRRVSQSQPPLPRSEDPG